MNHINARTSRLAFAALLAISGLLSIQPAAATATCDGFGNGIEDFSGYADFSHPANTCLWSNNNNGGYIVPSIGGHDKTYFSGGTTNAGLVIAGTSPCAVVNSARSISVEADLYFTASAGAADIKGISWGDTSAGGTSGNLGINGASNTPYLTGHVSGTTDQAVLPGAPGLSLNTWYHFNLTITDTGGTSSCNSLVVTGTVVVGSNTYGRSTTAAMSGTDIGTLVRPGTYTAGTGTFTSTADVYVDNFEVNGYATNDTGAIFCANPPFEDDTVTGTGDHPNYGYNYKRGGTFFDQSDSNVAGIGLSTGLLFTGGTSEANWDYTAKGLTTSTRAAHQNITIEGATDGTGSIFRVALGLNLATAPDATTKGNGLDSGHFDDHIEVQFQENGNTWQITAWYAYPAGARTQIGSAVNYGNSNDATPFTVWLDTRAITLAPPDSYFPGGGGSTQAGPWLAVTIPGNGPSGEDNSIILYRNLASVNSNVFLNDGIYNFWLIGSGDSGLSFSNTALDENDQQSRPNTSDEGGYDSTCIFDDEGTAVALGSSGSTPGSLIPDTPDSGGGGDTFFNGVTETALMGFLGIVLVASFAASMNEKTGAGAVGIVVFTLLGLFVAYFLNYIELWVVVAFTIMGLAICFLGIKSMASGSGL